MLPVVDNICKIVEDLADVWQLMFLFEHLVKSAMERSPTPRPEVLQNGRSSLF